MSFFWIVPYGGRNKALANLRRRRHHFPIDAYRIGIMAYQVKAGSVIIVTTNSAEALKIAEALQAGCDDPVVVRDMDGVAIDPERFRSTLAQPCE